MKNPLVENCPASTVTVMLALPAAVALVDSNTLLASELVSVTTNPPAGAAAPNDNPACTCKSLAMPCLLRVLAGAGRVAVMMCCDAIGVLKPVGTPTVICALPADNGWKAVSL